MDRRSFLRGLVMSVTASGLILPAVAEALILGDRYARLTSAIRTVIEGNRIYRNIHEPIEIIADSKIMKGRRKEIQRQRTAIWQAHLPQYRNDISELFRVLVEEFDDMTPYRVDPEGTVRRVGVMLRNPDQIDIFNEDELRQHEDIVVAIATIRVLFTKHHISKEGMHASHHCVTFIERYKEILRAA